MVRRVTDRAIDLAVNKGHLNCMCLIGLQRVEMLLHSRFVYTAPVAI